MKSILSHLPLCIFVAILTSPLFSSCGNKSEQLQAQIDSLNNVISLNSMESDYLRQQISMVAEGLDSITESETDIISFNIEGGKNSNSKLHRQQLKQKIGDVQNLLERHKTRIAELEKELADKDGDAKKLHSVIVALRQQVEQKDKELQQLRADLDNSRKSIAELSERVNVMQDLQDQQSRKIQEQDIAMNTGFIKLGTKKELKSLGLLTNGNLFKKAKVDYSKIDLSIFEHIDIRNVKTINLPKKYKILTAVPATSYEVQKVDGGNQLTILNTQQFWSVSNFLIIQID